MINPPSRKIPPKAARQISFDFEHQTDFTLDPIDWPTISIKCVIRLVRTLHRLILSKQPITKGKLDRLFDRQDEGVWSWDRRLRNLRAISIAVYGGKVVKGKRKPLKQVYYYKKTSNFNGEYIFMMTPREILQMIREYKQILRTRRGGAHA